MLAAAILTAAATVGLALVAFWQVRSGQKQTRDATAAALAIARETREAAERQWQPRVLAHPWDGPRLGNGANAAPDEMGVGYRLKNEGTGPAFNVEHGIEIAGKPYAHPMCQWPVRAGEEVPPMLNSVGTTVGNFPITVGVKLTKWKDGQEIVYWTRFENLLGERFEVRKSSDQTRHVEFRRLQG
jgi:hypothetical protein